MASLNKVFLIGNLTKDPEVRHTPSGSAVADLRLAVNRKFKSSSGEMRDETCYVNVTAWNRQAETCGEYLHRGSPILVEGRLKFDEWERDGQKQSRISVVAERVQFMSGRSSDEGQTGPPPQRSAPPQQAESMPPAPGPAGDDDDLPF